MSHFADNKSIYLKTPTGKILRPIGGFNQDGQIQPQHRIIIVSFYSHQ